MSSMGKTTAIIPCLAIGLAISTAPVIGASAADFYKGKRISVVVGSSPGGGFDTYARLVAKHMGDHLPGNPSFIVRNMPGAGSIISANYVYNVAPQDGTVLGAPQRGAPFEQILGNKGPKFDPIKFQWIGSLNNEAGIVKTWHSSPVKTMEDAFKTSVIMGSSGPNDSEVYPALMNNTIGTKFKIISGYPSSTAIDLAIERGEVSGESHSFSSAIQGHPDWKQKYNFLVQLSLKKHPKIPNVPMIFDYLDAKHVVPGVTVEEAKTYWRLMLTQKVMGRPYIMGPGVPAKRVKLVRTAFNAMVKDKAFLASAKKQNRNIVVVTGEEIQDMIKTVAAAPRPIINKLKGFIRYKGKKVKVTIKLAKHTGKVTKTKRGGRRIYIMYKGKEVKAKVSGSRTLVTLNGKKAKRKAVKPGMTCTFTYLMAGTEAKSVACK
jgi:tripartite-type tricarboxylate transporter receptor subunit TctC